jgi:hypothetical protein
MSVTPENIAAALGRTADLSTVEYEQWQMWISDALMLIGARLGDLTLLDQPKLDYVVREAVIAHVRNPDDATQVEVSVDDARSARTYRTSRGRVTIIDEWWALLSPGRTGPGAFSIRPTGCGSDHLPWCSLMLGATFCSCGVDIAGFPIYEQGGI